MTHTTTAFQQAAAAASQNFNSNTERHAAADAAFEDYDFGKNVQSEGDGGWAYTTPGNEWTQPIFIYNDEEDDFGGSKKVVFVVRFKPATAEIAEVYAIDSKGQIMGNPGLVAEVPAQAEMVTVEIKSAEGLALDWLVAKAMKVDVVIDTKSVLPRLFKVYDSCTEPEEYSPSTNPALAYQIMWDNRIGIHYLSDDVVARIHDADNNFELVSERRGPTPLIAAMRALVTLKLSYSETFQVPAALFPSIIVR